MTVLEQQFYEVVTHAIKEIADEMKKTNQEIEKLNHLFQNLSDSVKIEIYLDQKEENL